MCCRKINGRTRKEKIAPPSGSQTTGLRTKRGIRIDFGSHDFYKRAFKMKVITVKNQVVLFCVIFTTLLLVGSLYRKDVTRVAAPLADISSWTPLDIIGRAQDDPSLIAYIRSQIRIPSNQPYNLNYSEAKDTSQFNQTGAMKKLFGDKRNGFFIEAGAYDGERFSNTLYWERQLGWTGLLIEPDPKNFEKLIGKHRKAHILKACLCPTNVANMTTFFMSNVLGTLIEGEGFPSNARQIQVPCYPLYSILAAMKFPTVDFFSLDIEGWELIILKTVPFQSIDIKVLLVEFNHIKEGVDQLEQYMNTQGYVSRERLDIDVVFTKKDWSPS